MFDALLVSVVLSLLGGLLPFLERLVRRQFRANEESYAEKLSRLTSGLVKASSEVDGLLKELAVVAKQRAEAAEQLDGELKRLEAHEQELKKNVAELRAVPIPVAEHFAALVSKGERRSAWRDYILFGAGVVVSTLVAIILKLAGLG